MHDLFQYKYKRSSARLETWNYTSEGMYFITVCTASGKCYFGEIENKQMQLSELGKIVKTEWIKSIELRPDMNLELGEFVVMPNHFHGIIIIGRNRFNSGDEIDEHYSVVTQDSRDAMRRVSTRKNTVNTFGPQSKNLASIIRGFKSAVTTYARKNNIHFDWQSRFHDHVIRSREEYNRISQYIINNPSNWKEDQFFNLNR